MTCPARSSPIVPRPIIAIDPGHCCGVALFIPLEAEVPSGRILRYVLGCYGLLRPCTTPAVLSLFNQLFHDSGGIPCLYIEDQYMDPGGRGEKRLRGRTYDALVMNRARWVIMAELAGTPHELVNPGSWQSRILGLRVGDGTRRSERKELARRHVESAFGCKATRDEADAICIGLYAMGRESEELGVPCRIRQEGAPKKGERWH